MRHKYLPRFGGVVLGLGALGAAAGSFACSDPTGAGRGSGGAAGLVLTAFRPAGDTLAQRGVEFTAAPRDSTPMRALVVYVDSGTAQQTTMSYRFGAYGGNAPTPSLDAVAFAPTPGRHTFTLVVTDTAGRSGSARFARTFVVADEAYTLTALRDAGGGAGAAGLTPAGDVAGWVLGAGGLKRPAVWRSGMLQTPAVSDPVDVVAVRTNAAGDVLLQVLGSPNPPTGGGQAARLLRADGVLFALGAPALGAPLLPAPSACCNIAADLSEARRAVATTRNYANSDRGLVFDVARGAVVDSVDFRALAINAAGQIAGGVQGDIAFNYEQALSLVTAGLAAPSPAWPRGYYAGGYCAVAHGIGLTQEPPVDLDDAGALLLNGSTCGAGIYIPPGGSPVFVDRYTGPAPQVRLSHQGGVVAALDTSGALHLWRPAAGRVTRVRVDQGAWRIDSLAGVNARGQIAVSAVDAGTKRRGALLLTPAP